MVEGANFGLAGIFSATNYQPPHAPFSKAADSSIFAHS
jgi:hypothetical protein